MIQKVRGKRLMRWLIIENLLQITEEQREELERWARSRALPAGDVFRARLILAVADGLSYREIERKLGASARTVSLWKSRFEQSGIAGLQGQHKGSKPRVATPAIQARVIRRVQQQPSDGSTHWSCRKLADRLGLSKSTVQVYWQRRISNHIGWNATWRAMIRSLRRRPPTSLGCT